MGLILRQGYFQIGQMIELNNKGWQHLSIKKKDRKKKIS